MHLKYRSSGGTRGKCCGVLEKDQASWNLELYVIYSHVVHSNVKVKFSFAMDGKLRHVTAQNLSPSRCNALVQFITFSETQFKCEIPVSALAWLDISSYRPELYSHMIFPSGDNLWKPAGKGMSSPPSVVLS
ncbi:unnamed protein product [Dovyalis caffra]|uniref:Uncharacterized protein n=1 Tax=Dovyalis caffra TaxID=77055 RepID=A0AAV1QX18_9ROSI|nr:unnamed protein product [Dovyalis caffra]